MTAAGNEDAGLSTPSLRRRLACFIYEGVLLFGVLMISAYLFSTLTQQRNAMQNRHGLMGFLFIVLGIYFVWFWSHGGQTVAMKAWHIRVVTRDGAPLTQARAFVRYLLSYLWFLPALISVWAAGLTSAGEFFAALTVGVIAFAALTRLRPDRQFWHDTVCGTRLVTWRPAARGQNAVT